MILKHSVNILQSRFSLVYKYILFVLIVTLLIVVISVCALLPTLSPLYKELSKVEFFNHIGDALSATFSGEVDVQSQAYFQLKMDYHRLLDIFRSESIIMWQALIWVVVIMILFKFCMATAYLPTSDVINNFMSSNSRFGFTSNYIANIKQSLKYSLVNTAIIIPYYIITGLIIFGIIALLSMFSVFLAFVAFYILMIIFISLKKAYLACWLPTIVIENAGVISALKSNFKLSYKMANSNMGLYVMYYFFITSLTLIFGITTFGVGFFVAGAINSVLAVIMDMVIYNRAKGLRYYVDNDTIIKPNNTIVDAK